MSVTVTIPDHRPAKQLDGADMFGPVRYRDVKHPTGNRFVITPEGVLFVFNLPDDVEVPSLPLSQFTVAAYPAGQWVGAVRR